VGRKWTTKATIPRRISTRTGKPRRKAMSASIS
jgi:hypothetical protein